MSDEKERHSICKCFWMALMSYASLLFASVCYIILCYSYEATYRNITGKLLKAREEKDADKNYFWIGSQEGNKRN